MEINWDKAPVSEDGRFLARNAAYPRPLTASAVRINFKDQRETQAFTRRINQKNKWQTQAWDYYDYIGEIKFSANLVANTLSKITIFPAYSVSDDSIPTAVRHRKEVKEYLPIIEEIFDLLKTAQGGLSGYLRTAALSQFIAGEHYLIKEPGNPILGTPDKYTLRSVDEIYIEPSGSRPGEEPKIFIKPDPEAPKEEYIPLPEGNYIARMWRPHPRFSQQADSAMRGILDDADDLLTFSREARILSRSRSTASLLFLPDSLDDSGFPDDIDPADPDSQDQSDDNGDSIAEYISQALSEAAFQDEHVNHYAPIIIRGPAGIADDIRFIDLSRTTDNLHAKQAEDKLDRILNALDIPKDLAKGLSDLKYNSGALIEDSLYNSHVEPLILLIVDQLTSGFLRPALRAQGVPEDVIRKVLIWYNPSAIMAKPTKSQAANFGYEQNVISGRAWRDANGFNEADQPSERELALKILDKKLALDPTTSSTLLNTLLPTVMNATRDTTRSDTDPDSLDALNNALENNPAPSAAGDAVELTPDQVDQIGNAGGDSSAITGEPTPEDIPPENFIEP